MMPLFGGFLADAYTGRFSMVLLSSLVYLLVYIYICHFISFPFLLLLGFPYKKNIPRLSINASRPFIMFDNVTVMSKLGSEPPDNVPVHSKSKTMRCRGV